MEMENPIRAARQVIEADERDLPSKTVMKIEKLLGIAIPPAAPFSRALETLVGRKKAENRDFLFQIVVGELEKLLDQEMKFSDEHKRWVHDGFPGLLVEGLRRAEETRSRERIVRLAKVIRSALEFGPIQPADIAAEMMRVASELSEQDILALAKIYGVQGGHLSGASRQPDINVANTTWAQLEKQVTLFRSGDGYSICLKLQSLGLIIAVERIPTGSLGLQSVPFALLPKAVQFLKYIQDEAGRA